MSKLWETLDAIRGGVMIKGSRSDGTGAHCALGFIDATYQSSGQFSGDYMDDIRAVASVAGELFPERDDPRKDVLNGCAGSPDVPACRLAAFNNHPDTTKDDLELVFEKAAIRTDEILSV